MRQTGSVAESSVTVVGEFNLYLADQTSQICYVAKPIGRGAKIDLKKLLKKFLGFVEGCVGQVFPGATHSIGSTKIQELLGELKSGSHNFGQNLLADGRILKGIQTLTRLYKKKLVEKYGMIKLQKVT